MNTTMQTEPGETIYLASQRACGIARAEGKPVDFSFNGIAMRAFPLSFADDIAAIYSLKSQLIRIKKNQ